MWQLIDRRFVLLAGLVAVVGCQGLSADLEDLEAEDGTANTQTVDVATVGVDGVTTSRATFQGEVDGPRPELVSDHGFCWSRQPDFSGDSTRCESVEELSGDGGFEYTTDELRPGRSYVVHAFAAVDIEDETVEGEAISFSTDTEPVSGIEANVDRQDGSVEVSWESADGARGYLVRRDEGTPVEVDADQTRYVDDDIGVDVGPPPNLEASRGDYADFVRIRWDGIDVDEIPATEHTYTVAAVYPDADGPFGPEETVTLEVDEIIGYELDIDGDGQWRDTGVGPEDATELSYDHEFGDELDLHSLEADASQGEFFSKVQLRVTGLPDGFGDELAYRVRAVADLAVGEPSESVDGFRGTGSFDIQWQRADTDHDVAFSDLAGATSLSHDDAEEGEDGPVAGRIRYYRLDISDGDSEVITASTPGHRIRPHVYVADSFELAGEPEGSVHKVDYEASEVWGEGLDAGVVRLETDPGGDVYVADGDSRVYRFDSAGNQVWSDGEHEGEVTGLAVDTDGHVYSGDDDGTVRKLDGGGDELWSYELGEGITDLAADSQGFVYAGAESGEVHQIDGESEPDGSEWRIGVAESAVTAVALDGSGTAFSSSEDGYLREIKIGDELGWERDIGATADAIAFHPDGFVHLGGDDARLRQHDAADGTEEWSMNMSTFTDTVGGIGVDPYFRIFGVPEYDGADDDDSRLVTARDQESLVWDPLWEYQRFSSGTTDHRLRDVAVEPGRYGVFHEAWNDQ